MLTDFYILRLSSHIKINVQKNNLGGQIWYRSLDPVKKTASWHFVIFGSIFASYGAFSVSELSSEVASDCAVPSSYSMQKVSSAFLKCPFFV